MTVALGGIAYLVATILLGRYGRIPLERWLLQSTWGSEPNLEWTPAIELQEYEEFTASLDTLPSGKNYLINPLS
ncbi:hypothetical protein [Aeromonas sp. BIGb0445]|uniref:hypothetical protein n=1 Tax=Aeromonas sp. BIGb0445 TaxID=2940593 RepID=UPI002169624C|nr:hypothetical protein [Aeromonas sp. BIGb0445]MCS3458919.1 hypothetical protein [Aeromonas sp. BIGb0445]